MFIFFSKLAQRLFKDIERLNSEQKISKNPLDETNKKVSEIEQIKSNKTKADIQAQIENSNHSKIPLNGMVNTFGQNISFEKPVNNLTDGFRSPVYRLFFYL